MITITGTRNLILKSIHSLVHAISLQIINNQIIDILVVEHRHTNVIFSNYKYRYSKIDNIWII